MQDSGTVPKMVAGKGRLLAGGTMLPIAAVLGVLLAGGVVHRVIEAQIDVARNRSVPLVQPLDAVPLRLPSWSGRDEPIDEQVRRVAAEDSFINRLYVNDTSGRLVHVYVGYVGRPRSWLGHNVRECSISQGWEMVSEEHWTMSGPGGNGIPALVYEWRLPRGSHRNRRDLAIYVINGQYCNESDQLLEQYNSRDVFGESPRYVARIQLTTEATSDRQADLRLLSDLASQILVPVRSLLPDYRPAATGMGP